MKLWEPSSDRLESSISKKFINYLGIPLTTFHDLYGWSVSNPEQFWTALWDFSELRSNMRGDTVISNSDNMQKATWFPDAKLNFAENLLRQRDQSPAIIFWGQDKQRQQVSHAELFRQVAAIEDYFLQVGLKPGDRVAAFVPNTPQVIAAMLAAAACGAVWTSCSPDFGVQGVVDRFGQTEPKLLICADGYFFKDKRLDSLEKVREILPEIPSVENVIVFEYTSEAPDLQGLPNPKLLSEILSSSTATEPKFIEQPFNHPLYIMYSSGTTGKPKCIVHGAGGTLLEHLKEHLLHVELRDSDRIFYQTTCGWMMWNWLASGLAAGACLVLYDGFPFWHEGRILWELAEQESVTVFGTNAKYLALLEKQGLKPGRDFDLSKLHTILSTGSVLVPESFDYVYSEVKEDLCLSSISGGTDILGCFALGSPTLPVHRGELQTRSLAMKVAAFDSKGKPVTGEMGELVCCAPFPSMPIHFWNDPDGERYHTAYFSKFENVWHHGDLVELTENEGMIFYGRSDAVLNPGGVRIGTAEIYRQVEQFPEILESIVIGQEWNSDTRIVLFLRMQEGHSLDQSLVERLKGHIRKNASPFHVPSKIIEVHDIPRTRSGKIVELAVRDMVHGREIKNREALANPEALENFANLLALSEE